MNHSGKPYGASLDVFLEITKDLYGEPTRAQLATMKAKYGHAFFYHSRFGDHGTSLYPGRRSHPASAPHSSRTGKPAGNITMLVTGFNLICGKKEGGTYRTIRTLLHQPPRVLTAGNYFPKAREDELRRGFIATFFYFMQHRLDLNDYVSATFAPHNGVIRLGEKVTLKTYHVERRLPMGELEMKKEADRINKDDRLQQYDHMMKLAFLEGKTEPVIRELAGTRGKKINMLWAAIQEEIEAIRKKP